MIRLGYQNNGYRQLISTVCKRCFAIAVLLQIEELRLAWNTIKHSRNIKTDSFKLSHFLSVLKTLGVDLTQQELRVLQQGAGAEKKIIFAVSSNVTQYVSVRSRI